MPLIAAEFDDDHISWVVNRSSPNGDKYLKPDLGRLRTTERYASGRFWTEVGDHRIDAKSYRPDRTALR